MRLLILALLATLLPLSAISEDVVLKCKTSEGDDAVDLTVNLDQKEMTWGHSKYTIIHVNSDYITALNNLYDIPGGEVWLLHRSSGKYWRAVVSTTFCNDEKCTSTFAGAKKFEGTCRTNML